MPYQFGTQNNTGLPPRAVQSAVGLSPTFPATGKGLGGLPRRLSFNYSLGTAGRAGVGAASGVVGGISRMSFLGVTLTANGGAGGLYNTGANAAGGTATGGSSNATGGVGGGESGAGVGAGGGGGINLSTNFNPPSTTTGADGASALDFQNLNAALLSSSFILGFRGEGGNFDTQLINGGNASGIGAGGGGGRTSGANGGLGSFGGGGGGATGTSTLPDTYSGGAGGSGVLVIRINNQITRVFTTGTFFELPRGATSLKVWLIGAGGGGSGAPNLNTSGGGGGAGGIAYNEFIL
jgi:hypothetical protein